MSIVSVYATFGSDEEARRIGRRMVEERLAACVNILGPCHSIYRWQGRIEEAGEVAAIFKTAETSASDLVARIAELHSYDTPAAVVWPIAQASLPYAAWVRDETVV
ncbi:MAG TPA: divalent-cation tolerance protein CutA [Allosphingosinicella sp.]|nr:divalent-cation tolerance protein CutA [Allosphingosinicella sp.]